MQVNYLGNFRGPNFQTPGFRQLTLNGCEGPLTLYPDGTIAVRGHALYPEFIRLQVPAILDGRRATSVGDWFDPTNGELAKKLPVNNRPRGFYVDSDGVGWGTVNLWYNSANSLAPSHYRRDADGKFDGFYQTKAPRLKTAGYISELPQPLQAAWGVRFGFAETIAQGTMGTTPGPGLYSWDGKFPINETPRMIWSRPDKEIYRYLDGLREWDGSCEINGLAATSDELVWAGRTPTADAKLWYGETPIIIDPAGKLWPVGTPDVKGGVVYQDKFKTGKGYKSSAYRPVLFVATCQDLLAGTKKITEIDLGQWLKHPGALINICADQARGLLYVLEAYADSVSMPVFHVFQVQAQEDPAVIAELQKTIARLSQQLIDAGIADETKDARIKALEADRDAAIANLRILQNRINSGLIKLEEAVSALNPPTED